MVEYEVPFVHEKSTSVVSEQKAKNGIRAKVNRALLGVALFIACPGDDIIAITPSMVSGKIDVKPTVSPETIVDLYWVDKQTKDQIDTENKDLKIIWGS